MAIDTAGIATTRKIKSRFNFLYLTYAKNMFNLRQGLANVHPARQASRKIQSNLQNKKIPQSPMGKIGDRQTGQGLRSMH